MPPCALAFPSALLVMEWTPEEELGIIIGGGIVLAALLVYLAIKLRQMTQENWAKVNPVMDPDQVEVLMLGNPPIVVDLRSPEEFKGKLGHLRSAMNIPYEQLPHRLDELRGTTGNRPILLVDATGTRSHMSVALLRREGFEWIYVLQGGMKAWAAKKLPVYR
ncbi:MAG: rhodanese-like domain-containing protein [Acidobacteria bacterium]|nr:rhodanese-like domain-containing protein [Acidobacteriota bacterium]